MSSSTTPTAIDPSPSGAPTPSFGTVGQVALTVHDMPRAVAFYRDALGLRQLPIPAPPFLAFFDLDGIRLMLSLSEGEEGGTIGGTTLYFRVADIKASVATFRSRGVEFIGEPHLIAKMPDHELWMAFFRDPDGRLIGLMSEVR
jgi:methylmalonyl-CoA/ethylmalonyl-CoA epimerase